MITIYTVSSCTSCKKAKTWLNAHQLTYKEQNLGKEGITKEEILDGKIEKATKRLANTGEAETNTGLAGLGLAVLGSLLAVAKRRKKDEE